MQQGKGCRIGQGVIFQEDTFLGNDVIVGNHVTFYPNVKVRDGCKILDGAVIGRQPIAAGALTLEVNTQFLPVEIGQSTVIGCNSVIYTDVTIGDDNLIGDHVVIREGTRTGEKTIIGPQSTLHIGAIIGNRVRVSYQCMTGGLIEDDVFMGPGIVSADDNNVYLSRFGLRDAQSIGPILRRFAVVGVGATLLPNVEIGMGSLVAGGALVTSDVAAWTMVGGKPAKYLHDIPSRWKKKLLAHAKKNL